MSPSTAYVAGHIKRARATAAEMADRHDALLRTSHLDPEALRLHRVAESSERAGLLALAGARSQ